MELASAGGSHARLRRRLQAYASGKPDDFRDIRLDLCLLRPFLTDFQLRVLEQCRKIPYGATISYAELAAKAGFSRAARAVGNCMAGNLIPLLIPCHRVVKSDGQLGSYSAPGGVEMKRRLLASESKKLT
jgi:methylated-DNA-[protein]-cysteine S-methyltransferase